MMECAAIRDSTVMVDNEKLKILK